MAPRWAPLNPWQMRVLQWINDGCPDGAFEGVTYKTTTLALQSCHLVEVSKKGGTWRASLTEGGRYYLATGTYPQPKSEAQGEPCGTRPVRPASVDHPPPRPIDPARELTALADRVLASEGRTLVIQRRTDAGVSREELIKSHRRPLPNMPPGERLAVRSTAGWNDPRIEVFVEEDFAQMIDKQPVPVPQRTSRLHPAAEAYRERGPNISRSALARACRIIHALATEAERRGYRLEHISQQSRAEPMGSSGGGSFHFRTASGSCRLSLQERMVADEARPARSSTSNIGLSAWQRRQGRTLRPTGELELSLGDSRESRTATFRDGAARALEGKLPALLREVEIRFREDARNSDRRARAAEARQREWQTVMDRAVSAFVEGERAAHLQDQLTRWRTTRDLDEYLGALRGVVDDMADPVRRSTAQEWLKWIEQYRVKIDPLLGALQLPKVREPTGEDLRPHLGRWSPYGPGA